MSDVLLHAERLGKAYPRSGDARTRLGAFGRILLGMRFAQWDVLHDVGFTVRRGESLGIIGENGAGKSTLLKLISGVLLPSSGTIERQGTMGALLELGAGFDLERTGRENIAIAAGFMGWNGAQVRERYEEIVAFADIGRYIEEPVKHYSSGMVVRLGFAVIAAVRPDLLITDEVLAVGDESFQKKCIRWIEGYLEEGGTLLLVSHSMYHVQKLCRQALWLNEGRVQAYGDVFDVTQDYLAFHERKQAAEQGPVLDRDYAGEAYRVVRALVQGSEDEVPHLLSSGTDVDIEADVYSPDGRMPVLAVGVVRSDGSGLFGTTSQFDEALPERIDETHWRFRLRFPKLPLLPASYTLRLHAMDPEGMRLFDTVERGVTIRGASRHLGSVAFERVWG
ncbi:ABC transporter ATP-binding protein [Xanthomonadaceae bacterium JHOS43]|nr:ABC transporter ATP-binding protein [Xanthomonadaceae bacterium JHOS43]MCX7562645.1 ABC transporter ATP-binding protein [Xanthomonadaceae bacterium XH05]